MIQAADAAVVPRGPATWMTAMITGGILAAWTYGLMSHLMGIIWPEPLFDISVLNSYLL